MLARCTVCGLRPESKFAQTTWAWVGADGHRAAWRNRLCIGCYSEHVLAIDKPQSASERLTCPGCGQDTEDDYDAVYITAFLPGLGPERFEWPLCDSCAVRIRAWVQEHAWQLQEQEPESRGQAPSTPTPWQEVLRGVGIEPRDGAA